MSINNQLGKGAGLMLPSFTHNQPTVSLSGVSVSNNASPTVVENSPVVVPSEEPIEIDNSNNIKSILDKAYVRENPVGLETTTSVGRGQILNEDSSGDEDSDGSESSGEEIHDEKLASNEQPVDDDIELEPSGPLIDLDDDDDEGKSDDSKDKENDKQIETEVANEVRRSSVFPVPSINESIIADEEDVRATTSIETKRMRANSIKDIPNPSPNLKKQKAFDFQSFLKDFKSKECEPVHKYLKSFLSQFAKRSWTVEEQVKLIRDFGGFLFNKLIEHPPFNEIGDDDIKIDNCKEGLEKLILTRVYSEVFSPEMSFLKLTDSHKQDRIQDRKYMINLNLFDWIQLNHLDVHLEGKVDSNFMDMAMGEILKINQYKSPRDKIICILNSSKVIFGLIRQQKTEENADSFVPLLIYVLLKAKVKNLFSNLQYIERFRNEEFLVGETSYYVSTLQIACNFIIGINKDQLTITGEEFNKNVEESKKRLREIQQKKNEENSPSEILSKSAGMMKQSLSNTFTSIWDTIDGVASGSSSPQAESELERIKQLSIEEHSREQLTHRKENDVFNNLKSMFSNIDDDIIRDVMACCVDQEGVNIGECVNNLLVLGE